MWILGLKGLIARENNGTESKIPSLGLGAFFFFRQVNHLKLVRSWVLGRSTNFYSVLSRENKWTLCTLGVSVTIVCFVCFEEVVHGLHEFSNNQLNVCRPQELDFRLIIQPPEIT